MRTMLWWAFVAMLVVGVARMIPVTDPPQIHNMLSGTSSEVDQRFESLSNPLTQLFEGQSGEAGAAGDADQSGATTETSAQSAGEYDREDWDHWVNVRSCWTVREQVLARDAEPGSLRMLDENSRPTSDVDQACAIEQGKWVDPYSGKTFTNPSDLDVDHMIPLAWAHDNGAAGWSDKRKRKYANDLRDPRHLLAVAAGENRSKGADGPADYTPPNKDYWCEYGTAWDEIAATWDLTVPKADRQAIRTLQDTC